MGIIKDIFTHQNFGARDKNSRAKLFFARLVFDFSYICILIFAYYWIFLLIDYIFIALDLYNKSLFNNIVMKPFLFVLFFNIFNYIIYIFIKVINNKHISLGITILHRLLFILLKICIQYLLLFLISKIHNIDKFLSEIFLFKLSNVASIAFAYFSIVRIIINTYLSYPLWYARAKKNTKLTGYKDVCFYVANWCGDVFYVGTANDGTGKRMYNYYTGKGSTDGDKFDGMRLGLRFRIYNSSNPDVWEALLYIVFGAPYKNRENPLRSQNVKKTSKYKNSFDR